MNNELVIFDAETNLKEVMKEFALNFCYAFFANISTPLIILKNDVGILLSFLSYYFFLSHVLNRKANNSKFNRYVMMPIPCVIGAFTAYKVGYLIIKLITHT